MAFKSFVWLVLVLLNVELILTAPTWYHKDSWSYGPDLTYKDYLKKIGAYPRRFRYGTSADPVPKNYGSWFDPYPSWSAHDPQPQQQQQQQQYQGNWWNDDWNQPGYIKYNEAYEEHAQHQTQQMEKDVADILWRW